ncbi:hypothetical protein [Actinacidiphila alni]|uniref:hypothetical protein n=1 Tax=Actinacidiphila alni TaxID=380248 RepID=UPI003456C27F
MPSRTSPTSEEAERTAVSGWRPYHRIRLALALFFLAPLIGEYLLGNQPLTALPFVLLLAPMYGGGAVLIREATRRAGRGWPTMIVLASAYALVEEGPIDQMLWNPHYGGYDMAGAYAGTYVPFLGTSLGMIQDVLAIHTVWSICVPIVLVETFARDSYQAGGPRPWLGGRIGLPLVALAFLADSVFLSYEQQHSEHFMASPARLIGCGAVILALVAVAFRLPARPTPHAGRTVPRPRTVGAVAFAAASFHWARGGLLPSGVPDWYDSALWLLVAAAFLALTLRWTRSPAWTPAHRLALATAAVLTYIWVGFTQSPALDTPLPTALTGSTLFSLAALLLLHRAHRALTRSASRDRTSFHAHQAVPRVP